MDEKNGLLGYVYKFLDNIFSIFLGIVRKDDLLLNDEKFKHICECAINAYPNEDFYDYNIYDNSQEFLDGICCKKGKVYVLTGDNWYFIILREIDHYVLYDFASSSKKCSDMLKVYSLLINKMRGKKVFTICRESTSYPLIKTLEKRGKYTILEDEAIILDGEKHHKVLLKVKK